MLDRRRLIHGGLATAVLLTAAAPLRARAQRAKVRYSEVVRSVLYVPAYVAITKGYFEEQGIEQTMSTEQGTHLLRTDHHRWFHAARPGEGRPVRVEHAEGKGDPRLPPGQHASAVPGSGAAEKRHRPAEGRE